MMLRNILQKRWPPKPRSKQLYVSTSFTVHDNDGNRSTYNLSEDLWRKSCREHQDRILEILSPGLTPQNHPLNTGLQRQKRQQERQVKRSQRNTSSNEHPSPDSETITALDPKHPVYNFLIEYYGLKGTKGVRRLIKWPHGMPVGEMILEGATEQDFFTCLHSKGARLCNEYDEVRGIAFSPFRYVYGNEAAKVNKLQQSNGGPLASFLWYQSLLERTLDAAAVLHCYGLHEWAMQYKPSVENDAKSSLPPSAKYQSHLKLRIDRATLNRTVEENTLHCTHVDAWKFFAKEALPLNQFHRQQVVSHKSLSKSLLPSGEERPPWLLQSEQPACVHTTMDLLKIALKLGPFCEPNLFCRVLEVTVAARSLDVAASPYDAYTDYGVEPICIETSSGRNEYKQRQLELMKQAQPIRRELLKNYNQFIAAVLE